MATKNIRIPQNWQEITPELQKKFGDEIKSSDHAHFCNRFLDNKGRLQMHETGWEILDFAPEIGIQTLSKNEVSEWLEITHLEFAKNKQGVIIYREKSYDIWRQREDVTENWDVCIWCGQPNHNPETGESYRQGWDCYSCGGN